MRRNWLLRDWRTLTLREELDYDPETGIFRWKRTGRRRRAGDVAGTATGAQGYRWITLGMARFNASHVAWYFSHGVWPIEIDHINRQRDDNRLCNLREVTRSINATNTTARVSHGEKGVYWHAPRNKWRVHIMRNYVTKHLGYFSSFEEAIKARDDYLRARGEIK